MTTAKAPATIPDLYINLPLPDGTARRMRGTVPTESQLAVWQSAGERFSRLGDDWKRREQALSHLPDDSELVVKFRSERNQQAGRTLSRALTMIQSALADQHDRDWLEDALLFGELDLSAALNVITLLSDALRDSKPVKAAAASKTGKAKLVG